MDVPHRLALHRRLGWPDMRARQDRLGELTLGADNGDALVGHQLAELLADRGRIDEALTRLRALADNADSFAARGLSILLSVEERIDEFTHSAKSGALISVNLLTDLQAKQGQVDVALAHPRDLVDNGHVLALYRLDDLLLNTIGSTNSPTEPTTATPTPPTCWMTCSLSKVASTRLSPRLRTRAERGDYFAADRLVRLLAENRRIDELEGEVAAGTARAEELHALEEHGPQTRSSAH